MDAVAARRTTRTSFDQVDQILMSAERLLNRTSSHNGEPSAQDSPPDDMAPREPQVGCALGGGAYHMQIAHYGGNMPSMPADYPDAPYPSYPSNMASVQNTSWKEERPPEAVASLHPVGMGRPMAIMASSSLQALQDSFQSFGHAHAPSQWGLSQRSPTAWHYQSAPRQDSSSSLAHPQQTWRHEQGTWVGSREAAAQPQPQTGSLARLSEGSLFTCEDLMMVRDSGMVELIDEDWFRTHQELVRTTLYAKRAAKVVANHEMKESSDDGQENEDHEVCLRGECLAHCL
jgi:hypothetical protein